jgi:hypothetical protein
MPLWSDLRPPHWFPSAVATQAGWTDPRTGEVLITVTGLLDKQQKLLGIAGGFESDAFQSIAYQSVLNLHGAFEADAFQATFH